MYNETRRELDYQPCDKRFSTESGEELCHATGFEVKDGQGEWWDEFVDSEGNLHYGR